MKRRLFLGTATAVAIDAAAQKILAQETALEPDNSFNAGLSGEHILLQVSATSDGSLYCLQRKRLERTAYEVSKADPSGKLEWSKSITDAYVTTIAVDASQVHVLMRPSKASASAGMTRLSLSAATGERSGLYENEVPSGVINAAACGNRLVAYYGDGTVTIHELAEPRGARRLPNVLPAADVVGQVPTAIYASVEPISDDSAVVVDHTAPRIVNVNVSSGTYQLASIVHPALEYALENARKFVAGAKAMAGANGQFTRAATPKVIGATASNKAGGVYCLPGPVSPKRPVVLKLDAQGHVLGKIQLSLPDRGTKPDKVPFFLAGWEQRLALIFPEGDVYRYRLT